MSIQDRITLIQLAQGYKFYIVADEVYHLLDWSSHGRPASIAALGARLAGEKAYTVSVSSFTKIFGPGIRTGWIEASPTIIQQVSDYGYIQSQGGNGPFMNELLRIAMTNGIASKVLNDLIKSYQKRSQILVSALAKEPDIRVINIPRGGYFVWIAFPDWVDTRALLDTCRDRVTFLPGPRCNAVFPTTTETILQQYTTRVPFQNFARLCFADLEEGDLVRGAERLIEAYRAFVEIENSRHVPFLDKS